MSLFAVGGANAAIPEMHRIAVDVQHWMTDKQFADVFAISQYVAGAERADRDPDRLFRRRRCGRAGLQRWRCAVRPPSLPIVSAACSRDRAVRAGPPSFRQRWFRFRSG